MEKFNNIDELVFDIVRKFVIATGSERAVRTITLESQLDTELGIDSLGRVELLHRLEQAFNIKLPTESLTQINTVQDLIILVKQPFTSIVNNPKEVLQKQIATSTNASSVDLNSAQNLIDVLLRHVAAHPQQAHIYMHDEQGKEEVISYQQLFTQAEAVANGLRQRGINAGDTVAIMLPSSADFFYAFYGILLSGAIPVPIYPPLRLDRIEEYARLEAKILQNAEVRLLISFTAAARITKILKSLIPSLMAVTTVVEMIAEKAANFPLPNITADDAALIQYTSGSTGNPKGVLLLHRNLLANIRAIKYALQITVADSCVSWLPLYHDMGLMSWLASLYIGAPFICMSPITFLVRPERWLWALHYHRATISAAPNFAYELCVNKISANTIEGLDLSAWRCALSGAEAINPHTLQRFNKKFSAYGFKETTFFPAYGLAENTVGLLASTPGCAAKIDRVMREPFEQQHIAMAASPTSLKKDTLEFVCCGKPIPDHAVRLVDVNNAVITTERQIGTLQFQGPSAMQGYYRNSDATQAIYHEGWWDSGDLAYQVGDEFYIVGRKKDIIIKAGRNYYAEEIEAIVNEVDGIRRGRVVAFGISDATLGTERIIVVAEVNAVDKTQIQNRIIDALALSLGNPPDQVILVAAGTIGKTSSGKLQRSLCKQAYLQGELNKPKAAVSWQFAKLWMLSSGKALLSIFATIARGVYTFYLIFLTVLLLPALLCALLLPTKAAATLLRLLARAFLFFAACPVEVKNENYLYSHTPMLFVANHASYVDGILLTAILPAGVSFVMKEELQKVPLLKLFLKKMGCVSVNRTDVTGSIADAYRMREKIQQGSSIMVFPEGTFTYASGLKPFKSGAFKLAVENNLPICPIAIRGTRTVLRAGSALPRPARLYVYVSKPLLPQSTAWEEVVRLSKLAKNEIARNSDEIFLA